MSNNERRINNRIKKQTSNNKWLSNVARSMGFTRDEIVKQLLPNTTDFLEYNASDTMRILKDLKSNMGSRQMINRQFKNLPQVKIANEAIQNMKADLKSGNFYNKARSEDFSDLDDMDFSFGGFDESDSLSFIDDEEGEDNASSNHTTVINTLPLAKMINSSTEATVSTMISVAEQNMAIETEKIAFNHRSTNSI